MPGLLRPLPNLQLMGAVHKEQTSIAMQAKGIEAPVTGTTTDAAAVAYDSVDTDRAARLGGMFFIVLNTGGANSLTYRVEGHLSRGQTATDFIIIANTAVGSSSNSGILKISPGVTDFNIRVFSTVAGSATTYEIQVSYCPIGV